jgi:hypothetical protein
MVQISGIFMWNDAERRSHRYGSFYMTVASYDFDEFAVIVDSAMNASLDGKRVRIVAEVVQSRVSGHTGDRFYGICPSQLSVVKRSISV